MAGDGAPSSAVTLWADVSLTHDVLQIRGSCLSGRDHTLLRPMPERLAAGRCTAPRTLTGARQASQDGVGERLRGALGGRPRDGRRGKAGGGRKYTSKVRGSTVAACSTPLTVSFIGTRQFSISAARLTIPPWLFSVFAVCDCCHPRSSILSSLIDPRGGSLAQHSSTPAKTL